MNQFKIKSYAKINLALHVVGKAIKLHKIETIIAFVSLYDEIWIKEIKANNHKIFFSGRFSKNISKDNTITKLLSILEKRKLIKDKKFQIQINKRIPNQAGLGGGSMNAASIINFLIKKKYLSASKKEILELCKLIGSDVILGLNFCNSILTSKNKIKNFTNYKKINILIIKPNFGCSTRDIYSKVRRFIKPQFNNPKKSMFNLNFLKKMDNSLEPIAFSKFPKLKLIKSFLENLFDPIFVRMSGSGSALIVYYQSKKTCEKAKRKFKKKYKNYWCISSKTI